MPPDTLAGDLGGGIPAQFRVWPDVVLVVPPGSQRIPFWNEVVRAARRCSAPLELGYVGVDIVIDAVLGVQVLECNAYPGLEIQNVNGIGLADRLERAQKHVRRTTAVSEVTPPPAAPLLSLVPDSIVPSIRRAAQNIGRLADLDWQFARAA